MDGQTYYCYEYPANFDKYVALYRKCLECGCFDLDGRCMIGLGHVTHILLTVNFN